MISIVSPIYNEAANLRELVSRVTAAMETTGESFEYILVDNGSTDGSLEIIKELRASDPRIEFVSLSRNFGHQGGILAGIHHAVGDAVISLDGDLQHPAELLPKMVETWRAGWEIVFTTKRPLSGDGGLRFVLTRSFYTLMSWVSDLHLAFGQSDFRLLDARVVEVLKRFPEKRKFLRGLVEWVGFRQVGIEYEVEPRKHGVSKFSLGSDLRFAVDAVVSFSETPLRMFLWFGLAIAMLCLLYAGFATAIGLLNLVGYRGFALPPGWATITVAVMFLSAVQLLGIGMLGEYVSQVLTQTKDRPEYIVRETGLSNGGPTQQAPTVSTVEAESD